MLFFTFAELFKLCDGLANVITALEIKSNENVSQGVGFGLERVSNVILKLDQNVLDPGRRTGEHRQCLTKEQEPPAEHDRLVFLLIRSHANRLSVSFQRW